MNDKTGGQAFPCLDSGGTGMLQLREPGMTLRDYFAAKAMAAFISSPLATQEWIANHLVESAYGAADAMLKVRGEQ